MVRRVRIFDARRTPGGRSLEDEVNAWLAAATGPVRLTPLVRGDSLLVFAEYQEPEVRHPAAVLASVPTTAAERIRNGVREEVAAMAGVFLVPPGERFSPLDDEAAPLPLLSPDYRKEE